MKIIIFFLLISFNLNAQIKKENLNVIYPKVDTSIWISKAKYEEYKLQVFIRDVYKAENKELQNRINDLNRLIDELSRQLKTQDVIIETYSLLTDNCLKNHIDKRKIKQHGKRL